MKKRSFSAVEEKEAEEEAKDMLSLLPSRPVVPKKIAGKVSALKFRGATALRERLLLATLSGSPVWIDEIRSLDEAPGLRG